MAEMFTTIKLSMPSPDKLEEMVRAGADWILKNESLRMDTEDAVRIASGVLFAAMMKTHEVE